MNEDGITRIRLSAESLQQDSYDWTELEQLSEEEVTERALSDPDAQPMTEAQLEKFHRVINVKAIRTDLSMTQEQFARTFHLSLPTVRDWEQSRTRPDRAARTLLKVIAHNPRLVQEALNS